MKNKSKNNIQISTLHRFLNCIANNPETCIHKIYLKVGISLGELVRLKRALLPVGFIKSSNSTARETRLILTPRGHVLNYMLTDILNGGVKP